MSEGLAKRIDALLAAPAQARTRADWNAAFDNIKDECRTNPVAARLAELRVPFYGGYSLKQAIGPGGVLAVAAAVLRDGGANA